MVRKVDYGDESPERQYLCRNCRTQIAVTQDIEFIDTEIPDTEFHYGVFNNLVNVEVADEPHPLVEGPLTLADVSCMGCPWFRAHKIIEVEQEDIIYRRGRFVVLLSMLLVRCGNHLLYAHTLEPVEDA